MLKSITQRYKDLSTPERFSFAFYCDRCGEEWRSDVYEFNLMGFEPPVDEKIRLMVWNQQHEEAYERANREAGTWFTRCSCCGCRVCDDCLANVDLDRKCRNCAEKKRETP